MYVGAIRASGSFMPTWRVLRCNVRAFYFHRYIVSSGERRAMRRTVLRCTPVKYISLLRPHLGGACDSSGASVSARNSASIPDNVRGRLRLPSLELAASGCDYFGGVL